VVVAAVDSMADLPPARNPDRPGVAGHELGNYVAIARGDITVFLCHLRLGSVAVRVDEWLAAGTPIGRCGNSGRTTRPHLHLHAQDRPDYALRAAHGVPVAFVDGSGSPRVLGFGDVLAPEPGREPVSTASGL
jgi:murein DD-endopeptidase MepM/ murein hydrolase activator NlpD